MDRSGSEKPEGGVWSAGRVGNGFGAGAKSQDFHFPFCAECLATGASGDPPNVSEGCRGKRRRGIGHGSERF